MSLNEHAKTKIWLAEGAEKDGWREAVYRLLDQAEAEFIPALSTRESTSQRNLEPVEAEGGSVNEYFREMWKQQLLLAADENAGKQLAGFMSYKDDYHLQLSGRDVESLYVSTVVVAPEFRGHGITVRFYRELQRLADEVKLPIVTRTWSTNHAHLHILNKVGFALAERLENDRGAGIDTVYYQWGMNV